jgi:hypothetical protein
MSITPCPLLMPITPRRQFYDSNCLTTIIITISLTFGSNYGQGGKFNYITLRVKTAIKNACISLTRLLIVDLG